MAGKNITAAAIVVVIVVIAVVAALLSMHAPAGQSQPLAGGRGMGLASLSLTDPAQVPNGTSALAVDYSSLAVHSEANGWITSNTSGNVDLLTLVNASQVLGNINVSNGTSIGMVRFYISNAMITINGTTYNVTVPSGQITAQLNSPSTVGGVTKVLIRLSPVVITILTNTTPTFILVPSVKAIAIGNAYESTAPIAGERAPLSAQENGDLRLATPNVTITNASLSQENGTDVMSITVRDNSNSSVVLRHISVFGAQNVSINYSVTGNVANAIIQKTEDILSYTQNESERANASISGNVTGNDSISSNVSGDMQAGDVADASVHANSSSLSTDTSSGSTTNASKQDGGDGLPHAHGSASMNPINNDGMEIGNISGSANIRTLINAAVLNGTVNTTAFRTELIQRVQESISAHLNSSEAFQEDSRVLQFQISSNATLLLPFTEGQYSGAFGYNLSAGLSHTFTFSGHVSLANGRLQVQLVPGSAYSVAVGGEDGAQASTNVTAT